MCIATKNLLKYHIYTMKKNDSPMRRIREARNLSQRELAERINASAPQICALENGTRKLAPEWLDRISKALNCTKAELLGEEPCEELTEREKMLLDYFRNSDESGQDLLLKTGDTVSKLATKRILANDKTG